MSGFLISAIQIVIIAALIVLILTRPYLGIVITVASLPATDILPPIPLLTSVVSIFGYVTVGGYLMQRARERDKRFRGLDQALVWGVLFCFWIFVSNPQAAWFGTARNWTLTFVQLWMLALLAGELIDTPQKHKVLMSVYSIVTVFSALIAMQQGQIGENIDTSTRAAGLAEGANSAARYFVVAMIFLIYLLSIRKNHYVRLLIIMGLMITILGTVFTVSRTGILLLVVAFGLLIIQQYSGRARWTVIIIFGATLLATWFFADNIFAVIRTSAPSIIQGTDTIGERYGLWQAGWRMWLDHITRGVGIGLYPDWLPYYGADLLPYRTLSLRLGAHNMYIHVLSETGIIGFLLFISMLMVSWKSLWQSRRLNDLTLSSLGRIWFVVLIILLVGGITKSDQADKLLWLCVGVSGFFHHQIKDTEIVKKNDSQNYSRHWATGGRA